MDLPALQGENRSIVLWQCKDLQRGCGGKDAA